MKMIAQEYIDIYYGIEQNQQGQHGQKQEE